MGSRPAPVVRLLPRELRRARLRGDGLTADGRRIVAAQGARAVAYGLGSVLIGVTLARRGLSDAEVGAVLAALLAGTALATLLVGRYGDRLGRRRFYRLLFVSMAAAGTAFALTESLPALVLAALTGTMSTDVVESGPFSSLEQSMLPHAAEGSTTRVFGVYNTVATIAGSLGALVALAGSSARWLLAYPVAAAVGLVCSTRLSPLVEAGRERNGPPVRRSRTVVARLSALFALDSFGGGFVPQTFIAYLFARRYDASPQVLAVVFFSIGLIQALSFQAAVHLAERIGLLRTMVFTHLPSNALLAAIAFAPNLATAIALLLARFALSQMDVPARQAYVVSLVDPGERTAAAAYTNTARYVVRPLAPPLAGLTLAAGTGIPFLVAGTIKAVYDVALYALFRKPSAVVAVAAVALLGAGAADAASLPLQTVARVPLPGAAVRFDYTHRVYFPLEGGSSGRPELLVMRPNQ